MHLWYWVLVLSPGQATTFHSEVTPALGPWIAGFGLSVKDLQGSLYQLLATHKTQAITSWHFQLSINLAILGTGSILAGHILTAIPAYAYLRFDWSTVLSLFVHHAWIGGFFIVGAGAHGAIYLVKEYQLWAYTAVERVLAHRYSITVHLNWACIFLGFHSFGLYIHNDTLSALGRSADLFSDSAIVLSPAFGLMFQQLFTPEIYASGSVVSSGIRLVGTADT